MSRIVFSRPPPARELLTHHAVVAAPRGVHATPRVVAAAGVVFAGDRFRFEDGLADVLLGVPSRELLQDAESRLLRPRSRRDGVTRVTGGLRRPLDEMVLIDAHQPYEVGYAPRRTPALDFLYLSPAWLLDVAGQITDKPASDIRVRSSLRLRDPALRAVAQRYLAALDGPAESSLERESLAHYLAVNLLARQADGVPPARVRARPLPLASLQRVRDCIRANPQASLRLEDLATLSGQPVHRFLRGFARATGMTPHQYVLAARLEHAARLLRHSAESIAFIAADAGFSSQSHLTRAFRAHMGVTPAAYRRSFRRPAASIS